MVAHPDGVLADYLDSLRRLRDLGDGACCPGTGRSCRRPARRPRRTWRIARSGSTRCARRLATLGPDATADGRSSSSVYADVDRALWPAAELSVQAQLDYLRDAR